MAAFRFTITDHQAMMAAARRAMHKTRDQSGLLEESGERSLHFVDHHPWGGVQWAFRPMTYKTVFTHRENPEILADYAMPVRVYVEDPERVNYRDGYEQAARGRPRDRSDWAGIAFGASGGLVFGAAEVGVATTVFPSSVLIPACVLGAVPVVVGGYLGHRDARIESARKAWCTTDDDLRWALMPPTWRGRHRHPSAHEPQMPPNVREAFIIAASTWQDSIPLASQILELHDAYREMHERMFEVMRSAPTFAPSDAVSTIVGQINQWCGIITGLVAEYESNQHEIDQLAPEPETPHGSPVVLETEAAAERIARAWARLDAYQEIRSPVMSTHQVDPESSP